MPDGPAPRSTASRRIVITAFDDVTTSDISGPADVFSLASRYFLPPEARPYEVIVASARGGPVTTSSGITIGTRALADIDAATIDTLIVSGGGPPQSPPVPADLVAWLAREGHKAGRICAVCTGAFLVAEAGLFDGFRVTTHWQAAAMLAERYPGLTVDADPIFIKDRHAWSSAGFTAGLDLALAVMEEDHGHDVTMHASRTLVLFLRRPGEQPQMSAALASQSAGDPGFARLHAWMMQHLGDDLKVEILAERAGMAPRTFARRYVEMIGRTPAKSVEIFRLEAAQRELLQSSASLKYVARSCGFGNEQNLRRAFVRSLGMLPENFRRRPEGGFSAGGATLHS
jgi:transcriptional regulator GlxA family with amidase domain